MVDPRANQQINSILQIDLDAITFADIHGGKVLAVNPISAEEASAFYDLSMEEKWPVFGEGAVS